MRSLCSSASESSLSSSCSSPNLHSPDKKQTKRRLTFNSNVQVREYSLTVGNHPCCTGSLALQLDWQYATPYHKHISQSKHRETRYKSPPRLSLQDRRDRLYHCSDLEIKVIDSLIDFREHSVLHLGQQMLLEILSKSLSMFSWSRNESSLVGQQAYDLASAPLKESFNQQC